MAKGKKTGGGSRKGKPNKTAADVKQLVDAIFKKVDPVTKAIKLLEFGSDKTQAGVLMRLLEYRYGKPVQPISGPDGGAISVSHTIRFGDGKDANDE